MEDLDANGITVKSILEKKDGGMDWVHLAQSRVEWRAVVNKIMNLRFRKILETSCVTKKLLASLEGLSCIKLAS